jgi:hypothetical protein
MLYDEVTLFSAVTKKFKFVFLFPIFSYCCIRSSNQNNEDPAAPWGWLRSAYNFLCLFYAKYSRWFRNTPGRLSQKIKSFAPKTCFWGFVTPPPPPHTKI